MHAIADQVEFTGTKFRDKGASEKKNDGYGLSVLPDRNCDISMVQAAPEARFFSSGQPRRVRRHLVYPTANNWPEFSVTAREKELESLQLEHQSVRLQLHLA